jgi:hypothetical protein
MANKHSAQAEKARIASDLHLMRLFCSKPLDDVFQHAVEVVERMQTLAL